MRSHLQRAATAGGALTLDECTRTTVFGLDVYPNVPIALLGESRAEATGRSLRVQVHSGEPTWPGTAGVLCDERAPDGSVNFRIETHPEAGYLIWGPKYGHHLLSQDGREARCFPSESVGREWERLLIAQVLPFATLLRGFEVFHASAVVLQGHAVALLGPSGSGKTSVALELCRAGAAEFLADDVLALQIGTTGLLAHPGTPVAGVDRGGLERTRAAERSPPDKLPPEPDALLRNDRELLIAMPGTSAPAPLSALFFLDRQPEAPTEPRLQAVTDPRMLLSATFNFVLSGAERLRRLLEVCALAAICQGEQISVGTSVDAACVSEAILARLSAAPR